jgi:hypothetical protein
MGPIRRALSTKDARRIARADSHARTLDRSTIEAVGTLVRVRRAWTKRCAWADAQFAQNRGDGALLYTRGGVLFELGRAWEARRDVLEAERLEHRVSRPQLRLGWLALWTGDVEEAVRRMQRAMGDGDGWEAHFGLASALRRKGDWSARGSARHAGGARRDWVRIVGPVARFRGTPGALART